MLKEAGILFAITLIAGLMLGFVYELTKEPIVKQQEKAVNDACRTVFGASDSREAAESFKEREYEPGAAIVSRLQDSSVTIGKVFEAYSASGELLGYVIESTSSAGYGGNIVIYSGVELDGTLRDVSILEISETPGLGMRAGSVLVPQFHLRHADSFVYTKTGAVSDNEIDAISGATITTRAFTNAVNGALLAVSDITEGGE